MSIQSIVIALSSIGLCVVIWGRASQALAPMTGDLTHNCIFSPWVSLASYQQANCYTGTVACIHSILRMGTFTLIIFGFSLLFSITSVILKFIVKKMRFLVASKY